MYKLIACWQFGVELYYLQFFKMYIFAKVSNASSLKAYTKIVHE